jgi:5-formyltetrahydrofolate cyclo-ligase
VPQNTLRAAMPTSKKSLRHALLAQRHTQSLAQRQAREAVGMPALLRLLHGCVLAHSNPNVCVALYHQHAGEPNVLSVMAHLQHSTAYTFALPVVMGAGQPLQFAAYALGDALQTGAYGIATPQQLHWVQPDVVVMPCVGYHYDTRQKIAYRLGYGGGFYDRTLAQRNVTAVGVAWRESACQFEVGGFDVGVAVEQLLLL